jgi:DNA polymerase III delta prime subunit
MSTPSFAFPQSLADKYRPRTIADFVGLEKPKKILYKFAANPYPSAWLFVGPPGVGKTTTALALAEALSAELHHIPSQQCNASAVEDVIRQCWYIPRSGFHLVLVDEADRMSNAAQLQFLSKLDATAFPPQTIFVFTCNAIDGLELASRGSPVRSRSRPPTSACNFNHLLIRPSADFSKFGNTWEQ